MIPKETTCIISPSPNSKPVVLLPNSGWIISSFPDPERVAITLANGPPELLRKYASPKPLRRPQFVEQA